MPTGVHDGHKTNTEKDYWGLVAFGDPQSCWIWHGSMDAYGYGVFFLNKRVGHAHRFAWEFTKGPIPEGKHILHHCDNPPCCNPAHLYCGTPQDNANDKVDRGRHYYGDRHHWAKLTSEDVREIRRIQNENPQYHRVLAKEFGVSRRTIGRIVSNKIWKQT